MILYIGEPKNPTKRILELINEFGKVARYKINTQISMTLVNANNFMTEKELVISVPFTIVTNISNALE